MNESAFIMLLSLHNYRHTQKNRRTKMFYTNVNSDLNHEYETAELHETHKKIMLNLISFDVLRKKGRFQKVCYISLVNYTRCTFCFSPKDLCLNGARKTNKLTFLR